MKESETMKRIQAVTSHGSIRLFRNQVGAYRLARPDCKLCQSTGRVLRSGLTVGSSDLIGWQSITVQPGSVGGTVAKFVAIEVKSDTGTPTDEQSNFLWQVRKAGGLAGVARSPDDAATILA